MNPLLTLILDLLRARPKSAASGVGLTVGALLIAVGLGAYDYGYKAGQTRAAVDSTAEHHKGYVAGFNDAAALIGPPDQEPGPAWDTFTHDKAVRQETERQKDMPR